jgi:crossover junction endodeoxyribonuclease RusA
MDVKVYPPDNRRRDVDNVLKSLVDALERGGAYGDDSQIQRLSIEKLASVEGGKTIVEIRNI